MNQREQRNEAFDRCKRLLENFTKATENCTKRIVALENAEKTNEGDLVEITKESVIQTYEVAIELAWKTARCYALKIEPSGRVSGSTTAIKLALSTGVIQTEGLARVLLEAVQHRNMSSHEYLIVEGLDQYVDSIRRDFIQAMQHLILDLKEQ